MSQELTPIQSQYIALTSAKGYDAFIKIFEVAGHDPDKAKVLAEKESYHLAQLLVNTPDLQQVQPSSLIMEMRKLPMMGLSLDPTLKLAYLYVQDKRRGIVTLEANGRGKAVQAIAQNIISGIETQIVFEGDSIVRENGLNIVVPGFKGAAKVVGGFVNITMPDGRITQTSYNQSHIDSWKSRSAKKFGGSANANYSSFNGGIEPGFMESKMLKHRLDRVGINPMGGAFKAVSREAIERLPVDNTPTVIVEEVDAEEVQATQEPARPEHTNTSYQSQTIDKPPF